MRRVRGQHLTLHEGSLHSRLRLLSVAADVERQIPLVASRGSNDRVPSPRSAPRWKGGRLMSDAEPLHSNLQPRGET